MKYLPRKKVSKKGNDLPKEFLRNIEKLFVDQFKQQLKQSEVIGGGQIYPEEIQFCLSICNLKSLAGASIYVSSDIEKEHIENPETVTDILKSMVDVVASWMSQTFEKGSGLDALLKEIQAQGSSWQSFSWEKKTMYIRFDKTNMALEKAADDFLVKQGFDLDELDEEDEN
ncbi:MAG: hypothetical protein M9962_01510 [Oligoflexia bacterium]|nr:hypothetical protein [Oligoflexia bacterium]